MSDLFSKTVAGISNFVGTILAGLVALFVLGIGTIILTHYFLKPRVPYLSDVELEQKIRATVTCFLPPPEGDEALTVGTINLRQREATAPSFSEPFTRVIEYLADAPNIPGRRFVGELQVLSKKKGALPAKTFLGTETIVGQQRKIKSLTLLGDSHLPDKVIEPICLQ